MAINTKLTKGVSSFTTCTITLSSDTYIDPLLYCTRQVEIIFLHSALYGTSRNIDHHWIMDNGIV